MVRWVKETWPNDGDWKAKKLINVRGKGSEKERNAKTRSLCYNWSDKREGTWKNKDIGIERERNELNAKTNWDIKTGRN